MKNIRVLRASLFAVAVAALFLAGCHTVKQILPDHPRMAPGVAMQDVTFYSSALQRQMPYRVFLPAKVLPGQKLPVVYLLHGGNGGFRDWSNDSDVAHYAVKELILVMPEGAFSYYQNAALKPKEKYEDYLTHDLIADVEARFPAARDREHRAIIGISMGGFATIKLALNRPELFGFIGAFSPPIDVCERRFNMKRTGEWWRLRTIFGPTGSETRDSADPFIFVQTANPALAPHIYLTAGNSEPLLDPNRRFAGLLKQRGFDYEFHTKPGGHDWGEWNSQIPGCFESLLRRLPAAP